MGVTVPEGLKEVLNLIGVPYPDVHTDGMHQSAADHAQAQSAADTSATQAHDAVARTIGPDSPAYTGDAADAMGGHSAQTDQHVTAAHNAISHIPGVITGAAKVVTSGQVAMIGIAAVTAVALVRNSLIGGPFGPAASAAQILESRAQAEGVVAAADEGTNVTLSKILERYVNGPLRDLLEKLRLTPGEEPLTATGPTGTLPASDTRLAADSSRKLTTDSLEPNKGEKLNSWRRGGGSGGGGGASSGASAEEAAKARRLAELEARKAQAERSARGSVSGFFHEEFTREAARLQEEINRLRGA
ncbi:hypothetical protein OG417_07360 [Actinoallomurus sp. NBC_01490]|uniref:hypothetical protein n=1 Tax=Actinoallomurus sp. NBC_01490 TaxID=2903557 RepID=UPI002E32C346|nr:hypothetical protein [Actinoallomurus sp. NBC_01490]